MAKVYKPAVVRIYYSVSFLVISIENMFSYVFHRGYVPHVYRHPEHRHPVAKIAALAYHSTEGLNINAVQFFSNRLALSGLKKTTNHHNQNGG
jgi:hypothetical protein